MCLCVQCSLNTQPLVHFAPDIPNETEQTFYAKLLLSAASRKLRFIFQFISVFNFIFILFHIAFEFHPVHSFTIIWSLMKEKKNNCCRTSDSYIHFYMYFRNQFLFICMQSHCFAGHISIVVVFPIDEMKYDKFFLFKASRLLNRIPVVLCGSGCVYAGVWVCITKIL